MLPTEKERHQQLCRFLYYDAQMLNFPERMIERFKLETQLREFDLQMRYKHGSLWRCMEVRHEIH